jgi:hypothetical protein
MRRLAQILGITAYLAALTIIRACTGVAWIDTRTRSRGWLRCR